jgi:1-acyl-sn-glycerol-3-phosphate acyltransferase
MVEQLAGRGALDLMIRVSVEELMRTFRLYGYPRLGSIFRAILRPPSVVFSRRLLEYDSRVAELGLADASIWLARRFVRKLIVVGGRVPCRGPVLVTANHPGQSDTLALMGAIGRDDLRVIAAEREMLQALPNISRLLLYVPEGARGGGRVLREAARHLRSGGALLTFPAGAIEPDPALHADAADSLARWSDSPAFFTRLEPGLVVVPALVSGVLSPRVLRNPLVRRYRGRERREWVAATLQVMFRRYQDVTATVAFGEGHRFDPGADRARVMDVIRAASAELIRRVGR